MKDIIVKGRLNFTGCKSEFSRDFVAKLKENDCCFDYGNKTMVVIEFDNMVNGRRPYPIYLDTRYSKTIRKDRNTFELWLSVYFYENYDNCSVIIK